MPPDRFWLAACARVRGVSMPASGQWGVAVHAQTLPIEMWGSCEEGAFATILGKTAGQTHAKHLDHNHAHLARLH